MALSVGSSVMNVKYTMLRIHVTYQYHVPNFCINVTDLEQMSSDMFCRWMLRFSSIGARFLVTSSTEGCVMLALLLVLSTATSAQLFCL